MKIEEINGIQAEKIIDTREPRGLFYINEKDKLGNDLYVGIDNSSGHANVEEFENREDCISWLLYGAYEEVEYNIEVYQYEIFNHYGFDAQLDQLVEECSELIQSVCKYKRNFRNLKSPRILGSLIEEIADVKNLIEQLELSDAYIARRVEELKESKVKRQIKRIQKEVKHDKTS